MGGKQSTTTSNSRVSSGSGDTTTAATGPSAGGPLSLITGGPHSHHPVSAASTDARLRARSLTSVLNLHSGQPLSIPASQSGFGTPESPPESGSSTPDNTPFGRVFAAHSLPVQLVSFNGKFLSLIFNPCQLRRRHPRQGSHSLLCLAIFLLIAGFYDVYRVWLPYRVAKFIPFVCPSAFSPNTLLDLLFFFAPFYIKALVISHSSLNHRECARHSYSCPFYDPKHLNRQPVFSHVSVRDHWVRLA